VGDENPPLGSSPLEYSQVVEVVELGPSRGLKIDAWFLATRGGNDQLV
jgi:hypothetical protein